MSTRKSFCCSIKAALSDLCVRLLRIDSHVRVDPASPALPARLFLDLIGSPCLKVPGTPVWDHRPSRRSQPTW